MVRAGCGKQWALPVTKGPTLSYAEWGQTIQNKKVVEVLRQKSLLCLQRRLFCIVIAIALFFVGDRGKAGTERHCVAVTAQQNGAVQIGAVNGGTHLF